MKPIHYFTCALLIASAALAGYIYASQPRHAEAIVLNELRHNEEFRNKLACLSGGQDFLKTLTQGAKPCAQ